MASHKIEREALLVDLTAKLRTLTAAQLEKAHCRVWAYGLEVLERFLDDDLRELAKLDRDALSIERLRRVAFPRQAELAS